MRGCSLGVRRPRFVAWFVRNARIVFSRRFGVALRLLAPDLRREIPEESQLLDHPEIMRWRVGGDRGRRPDVRAEASLLARRLEMCFGLLCGRCRRRVGFLPPRGIHGGGVGLLLLVECLEKGGALLRRRLHERRVIRLAAGVVELLHAVAKDLLFLRVVAVGDHDGHEWTNLGGLRARRLGFWQNCLGDLIEQAYIGARELPHRLARLDDTALLLTGGQERASADKGHAAEEEADATNRLATINRAGFRRPLDQIFTVRHRDSLLEVPPIELTDSKVG